MSQKQYKPHFEYLKNRWTERRHALNKTLWEKHKESLEWLQHQSKQMLVGSMAGMIILSQPSVTAAMAQQLPPTEIRTEDKTVVEPVNKDQLIVQLASALPKEIQPLSGEEEKKSIDILQNGFHLKLAAEMQGKRLNRNYGYIGAEQHLTRYAGDTMDSHLDTSDPKIYSSGMAPGRGAWGYFADSREAMTAKDIEREKYYIAVPTFLAPGYMDNVKDYYQFFKYRKMLMVNPENGKACVVVIGDSGPAAWTGKHAGGSPEVMLYLERKDGAAKGPVLYFFIEDPDDKVPLGPITI